MIKARNNKVVVVSMEQKERNNKVPGTSPQRCSRESARLRAEALEEGTAKAVRTSAPLEVLAAQVNKILSLGTFQR